MKTGDIVDLRDLDGDELAEWKEAIESESGYDFDSVLRNEPVVIAEEYFTEYAEELAEELGYINGKARWPLNCIDWSQAAEELKQDYTSFTMNGTDYWFRAF